MNLNEKSKQALTVGLIGAGMLLFVIIYVNFMILSDVKKRNQRAITEINSEITEFRSELQTYERYLRNEDERQRMLAVVEEARSRLPESENTIEFFDIIRESARRTGIGFSKITPLDTRDQPSYSEIPYSIQGDSRYHEFGQFLNLIECHPDRFLRVNSFRLTNNDQRPSIHPTQVQISTFTLQN